MPATHPPLAPPAIDSLKAIGATLRARRKAMKVSAVAASEAAGISRVTLHRIEKGQPSVTMGSYMAVMLALGLQAHVEEHGASSEKTLAAHTGWIPARVRLADYPALRELAWQVHGTAELTPREALDIYERNARHIDQAKLSREEADLVDSLRLAVGAGARV